MPEVVICEPLRTPVGRYGGALASVSAADLGVRVLRALLERTGIDPGDSRRRHPRALLVPTARRRRSAGSSRSTRACP